MKLGIDESRVLKFVLANPDSNIASITDGTGMKQPNVSKAVDALEEKGVVVTRKEGTQTLVRAVEGIKFVEGRDGEIIVPSDLSDPFLSQLEVALRQHLDRRESRNFDAMWRLIERDVETIKHNPWALEDILHLYNVRPHIIALVLKHAYGPQELEDLKRTAPRVRTAVPYGTTEGGTIITTGGAGTPQVKIDVAELIRAAREPSQPGGTVIAGGERVIERRVEMETVRQPILDKEGKPIMGPDGKPLMQEVQRPMVISSPSQQQWSPKDMYDYLVKPMLEQLTKSQPKSAEGKPPLDEDKLVEKISRQVKEPIEKRIDDIEKRWDREMAYREGYEKAAKEYGGAKKPLEHHKLDIQKDLIEQGLLPEVRGMRADLKDFGLLHIISLIEERRGMAPGTLLTPIINKLGLGGVMAGGEVEEPTTIAEKRAFIAKLRTD